MNKAIASIVVLSLFAGGALAADVYDNEADFLAAIGTTEYLLEEFTGVDGLIDPPYVMGPEYGYYGEAWDEGAGDLGLWGCAGSLSTNSALNLIYVDFTGSTSDVYSTGGFFWPTDIGCTWIQGNPMQLELSDGTFLDYVPSGPTDFVGFVSDEPLDWIRIEAPDVDLINAWATVDHFYIDSPEPGSLVLLAIGALVAIRRR